MCDIPRLAFHNANAICPQDVQAMGSQCTNYGMYQETLGHTGYQTGTESNGMFILFIVWGLLYLHSHW